MKKILCLLFLAVALCACQKEPFLSVNPSSISFDKNGGSQTVTVSANNPWTASVSGNGFSLSPKSGNGEAVLTVTAAAASSAEVSTGSITITSEGLSATVSLSQEAKNTIKVGQPAHVSAEGGTYSVSVQYNTDYDVIVEDSAKDWIKYVRTKAMSSGELEFEIAANGTTEERSGKVTLKDKAGEASPVEFVVIQDPIYEIKVAEIPVFPGEGGGFDILVEHNVDLDISMENSEHGDWITCSSPDSGLIHLEAGFNCYPEQSAKLVFSDSKGRVEPVRVDVKQNQSRFRQGLVKLYDALDGPNWKNADGWCTEASINDWNGIDVREVDGKMEGTIDLQIMSLKGQIPDCFEYLSEILTDFTINQGPNKETESRCLSGTLPPSFAKCTRLRSLSISNTWMSSLPDIFSDMPDLKEVNIQINDRMTGPLPESLGNKEGMTELMIGNNRFTGEVPPSWTVNSDVMILEQNCLSGVFPDLGKDNFKELGRFIQKDGYGFELTGRDFYGYWPETAVLDAVTQKEIPFWDEVRSSKYTVMIHWGTWCPFSKELMPMLKAFYNKYHTEGLAVFAYTSDWSTQGGEDAITVIKREGYDRWYNFTREDIDSSGSLEYGEQAFFSAAMVPVATVLDSEGKLIWSGIVGVKDPVEKRFNHTTSSELIPFLETLFGPLSDADTEYSSTDYSNDGLVTTIQTASVGKGINIVFMGDGYADRDISSGLYDSTIRKAVEEFFAIEPYKSFRNRFNVYEVSVVSKNAICGPGFETALGSSFGSGTYVEGNLDKCYEYAMKVPGISSKDNLVIPVIVNTSRHCGTTFMSEPSQSAVAFFSNGGVNDPVLFGSTLRHEAGGHGFGFLSDEYITSYSNIPESVVKQYGDQWEKYGWWANVDFTSDPSRIKWSKFLTDDRYKSEVGIYEGGATYRYGAWKPTANSMMNENLDYFNAPSREAIYKRIMELSGEGYSFEKFLEYDAINHTSAAKGTARPPLKAAARAEKQYGAPPVVIR